MGDLFGIGTASDPVFEKLRQGSAPNPRAFAERLWDIYQPNADSHFLSEIRREFSARFWEMYLYCALLERSTDLGYVVSCQKPGPDVLLESNYGRVWIEAVTPTNGEPGRDHSLAEPLFPSIVVGGENGKPICPTSSKFAEDGRIPEEMIVLRYTSAIRDKYVKYLGYLKNGIIDKNDAYVIAINKSRLAYQSAEAANDLPRFLKAVFPVGDLEVLLDKETRNIVGHRNRPRFSIPKGVNSSVSVQLFVSGRKRGISAILCSAANPSQYASPLGSDFDVAHNLLCRQPIFRGLVPAAREWWAELNGEEGELFCDPERS